jgi:tetratricopeptide (TPR) repeat protein
MKDIDRAVALLLAGIAAHPAAFGLHVALAYIYAEAQRFEDADVAYEAARAGEQDEVYYRALYGQARMRIVNEFEPERAIGLLDMFIAGEPEGDNMPSVAHAFWRKGNALEQLQRNDAARKAYEESLRLDPDLELAKKALSDLSE